MASIKHLLGRTTVKYRLLLCVVFVLVIGIAAAAVVRQALRGQPDSGSFTDPLDLLKRTCESYMPADDPYAFALKIRRMLQGYEDMWGGGKELFFDWCRTHAADFLADRQGWVPQHGDPHAGNLGTYLAAGTFGTVAFGLVDYDESHRLPVQLELLQIVIGLRVIAEKHKIPLDSAKQRELVQTLFDNYTVGLTSDRTPTQLLSTDPLVKDLLRKAGRQSYQQDLSLYVDEKGRFHRLIPPGELRDPAELLRPAPEMAGHIAAGIAQAIARSEPLAKLFRYRTEEQIRAAIRDVARRINLRSGGSQGVRKYLVLMDKPFTTADHDIILYVKQQIPSAAERVGLAEMDSRPAAQRCAEDSASLAVPPPFMSAWFRIGDDSYTLSIKEPWTRELGRDDAWDYEALLRMARISAVCAGSTHRQDGLPQIIRARLTPRLADQLLRLSNEYLSRLRADSKKLKSDPRADALSFAARRAVLSHINNSAK